MGHTQGPWAIDDRPGSDWVFIEPDVCQIPRGAVHNAALIAAAPDMLAVLEALVNVTDEGSYYAVADDARAAIARAKGGQ